MHTITKGQEIVADLSNYVGEWVIIVNKNVIEHGNNLKEIYNKVKGKYPHNKLLIGRVPDRENLIL